MKAPAPGTRGLTALIWRERLRKLLPLLGLLVALVGAGFWIIMQRAGRADPTVEVKSHAATVVLMKRPPSRGISVVNVKLDDGRDVEAISLLPTALVPGTHVVIAEARHASGRLTYDVSRVAP
jgi:hypothetical protein